MSRIARWIERISTESTFERAARAGCVIGPHIARER